MNKDQIMARRVAELVEEKGGRTFYVGGYVRDLLMGDDNKDIDIEVHGIRPDQLKEILDQVGKRTEMGSSFGIFGLRGCHLDIAMPRREEATGRGHKDFEVFVDPFLGTKKAALRRDFTMNALMQDVLTGEIVDHFHGREDLAAGILRHVNDESFGEDPLRVLRGAQFAARFGFEVAKETIEISKTMDLTALAKERIYEEVKKGLEKGQKPSVFFRCLREMDQLGAWFCELQAMTDEGEDGDWRETMELLDYAVGQREQASWPMAWMLTLLCRKMEKGQTEAFIKRITGEVKLYKYVENMEKLLGRPGKLAQERASIAASNLLFDQALEPADLLLAEMAIESFQSAGSEEGKRTEKENFLRERLDIYQSLMKEPQLMGEDLVQAGLRPGPKFGKILAYSHRLHLEGKKKEEVLPMALAYGESLQEE